MRIKLEAPNRIAISILLLLLPNQVAVGEQDRGSRPILQALAAEPALPRAEVSMVTVEPTEIPNGLKWRGLEFCTGSLSNRLLRPRNSAYNLAFTKL
jgi:hypothetical protein